MCLKDYHDILPLIYPSTEYCQCKIDSAQNSSDKCKSYLLKIYSEHSNIEYYLKHLSVIYFSK